MNFDLRTVSLITIGALTLVFFAIGGYKLWMARRRAACKSGLVATIVKVKVKNHKKYVEHRPYVFYTIDNVDYNCVRVRGVTPGISYEVNQTLSLECDPAHPKHVYLADQKQPRFGAYAFFALGALCLGAGLYILFKR